MLGSSSSQGTPTRYTPDKSHPFYPEMLQFFVSFTTLNSLLISAELYKKQQDADKKLVETQEGKAVLVVIPDLRMPLIIAEQACDEQCVIYPGDVIDYLLENLSPPSQLHFEMRPFVNKVFPKPEDVQIQVSNHMATSVETLVCYLIGGAFERYSAHFENTHGSDPKGWSPELQFFKYLRNACFHSNTFSFRPIRGVDRIDPTNPPQWHTYTMPSDLAMKGRKAIDEYFLFPHVLPFLHRMAYFV